MQLTPRVKQILSWYESDNPGTKANLARILMEGKLGGTGRMVAYKNDQDYVKLHLPLPHQFLPVYQDGPLNWTVPGIMRIGGVELLTTAAFRYIDGISEAPTPA